MVYINEAHAADDAWPVPYAKEKGIKEHTSYGERCTTAQMLIDEKKLTLPCLIDGMDNAVNKAYQASPDRVFLVRTDGKLAVAADRGPWGFKPGLSAVETWLKKFKESGAEPPLPTPKSDTAEKSEAAEGDAKAADGQSKK